MKSQRTFAIIVALVLIVLAVVGNRLYQTKADGNVAPEVILSDAEQKPLLEIIEAKRQSALEFDNQLLAIVRYVAQQKGLVLGNKAGQYRPDQSPNGRIRYVQNLTDIPQAPPQGQQQ